MERTRAQIQAMLRDQVTQLLDLTTRDAAQMRKGMTGIAATLTLLADETDETKPGWTSVDTSTETEMYERKVMITHGTNADCPDVQSGNWTRCCGHIVWERVLGQVRPVAK